MSNYDYDDELARLLKREMLKFHLAELERLLKQADAAEQINLKNLPAVGLVEATIDLALEVKSADDASGMVEGYLSVFGNEDLGHDVVDKGAFAASLAKASAAAARHGSAALYPLLFQHDAHDPIGGIVAAKEDIHGLRIKAHINTTVEHGRQAYHGLKHGYMGFSIGYRPVKYEYQGTTRHLKEIALAEGSAVTFPMNTEARALRSMP